METATREYRIWLVTGDLIGCASVYKRRAWWTVEPYPFYAAESRKPKGFRNQQEAYDYAMKLTQRYMSEVVAWEKEQHGMSCTCSDEELKEFEKDYAIQVVDNGRTLETWEI